jgi:hypothetical protein
MSQLVPHLLLRADAGTSRTSALLRTAGYMVSKVIDDAILEQIAGAPHVDGVIVELPALSAIAVVRRIQARYGHGVAMMIVTESADTVRRALPSMQVIRPAEVDDDLISAIDLTLVAHKMRRTG